MFNNIGFVDGGFILYKFNAKFDIFISVQLSFNTDEISGTAGSNPCPNRENVSPTSVLNFFLRNNFCYDDRKIRIRQI
jgi:hypothetical protein